MPAASPSSPAGTARYTLLPLLAATLLLGGCVIAPAHGPRPVYRVGPPSAAAPVAAVNEPMYFYPQGSQSPERQDRDRYECYRLAVRDSGIDPGMNPVSRPWSPPPPPVRRDGADVVAGAATGAIVGAAVSSPRHAGPNAIIGAVFGALLGAAAQESRAQAAEAAQARHAEASARARWPMDNFRRAMGACMQSRGYTVG
ncbi:YMGG-like glycine zipper-containing protein [Pseudorhodoferax sp.]|uniref:YMGG-like glycine zipper-containing protein n=1 Tax=Pseudorhodoferax sp. TaxID=1993553 RepID=UPI002DD64F02|nr:YMGG-like glycine zipper-containing protein [Pseudorhodoferax sp.]